jgi:hypothetical protein
MFSPFLKWNIKGSVPVFHRKRRPQYQSKNQTGGARESPLVTESARGESIRVEYSSQVMDRAGANPEVMDGWISGNGPAWHTLQQWPESC